MFTALKSRPGFASRALLCSALFAVVFLSGSVLLAQTIDIGPNQYAFQFTSNPNYGLFFNSSDQQYEFRNGSANPIFAFDANDGKMKTNLQFESGSDFYVAPGRYAFRSSLSPNVGLYATSSRIQFLNSSASPIFSLNASDGSFDTDLKFMSGKSIRVQPGAFALRSAASSNAGLFFGASDFEFRSTSGANVFSINSISGNVSATGNFATTGTVGAAGGSSNQWNAAHSWGNHASAGYITSEVDPQVGTIASNSLPTWNGSQLVTSVVTTGSDFAQIESGNASLRLKSNGFLGGTAKVEFTNGTVQSGEIFSALGGMFYNNNSSSAPVHAFQQEGQTRMIINVDGKVGINSDGNATSELKINRNEVGGRGLDVEVTYDGNSDVRGVYASSITNDGFGIGVEGIGGWRGVFGSGAGGSYTGTTTGIYGIATGSAGTRIGVFGTASGGTSNWAGYFSSGNVYVSNDLRIGSILGAAGYKLSVNGKIMCTELRVLPTSSWPDYVFANDYELMPLNDLESYIEREKHLPGMPAASEIDEGKGFDVGEMQRRTVEKVEELTLYVIQANKTLEKANERLNELDAENKQLRMELNELKNK